jgi:hypothetical protein
MIELPDPAVGRVHNQCGKRAGPGAKTATSVIVFSQRFRCSDITVSDGAGPDSFEWPAGASTDASTVRGAGSRVAGHRPAQRSVRLRRA